MVHQPPRHQSPSPSSDRDLPKQYTEETWPDFNMQTPHIFSAVHVEVCLEPFHALWNADYRFGPSAWIAEVRVESSMELVG